MPGYHYGSVGSLKYVLHSANANQLTLISNDGTTGEEIRTKVGEVSSSYPRLYRNFAIGTNDDGYATTKIGNNER